MFKTSGEFAEIEVKKPKTDEEAYETVQQIFELLTKRLRENATEDHEIIGKMMMELALEYEPVEAVRKIIHATAATLGSLVVAGVLLTDEKKFAETASLGVDAVLADFRRAMDKAVEQHLASIETEDPTRH